MSGYDTVASCPSFIDIAERIDDEIVSDVSSSFRQGMVFVDILQLLDDRTCSSRQQRGVVVCGMMDDDLGFALMDALGPLEIIAVIRFAVFIDHLFGRRHLEEIVGCHLPLVFLFLDIEEFLGIGLHELIEFCLFLLRADSVPLCLGFSGISP